MPRFALVLRARSGDRTELEAILQQARAQRRLAGFYQTRSPERVYHLHRVYLNETVELGSRGRQPRAGELAYCNLALRPDSFATARAWLTQDAPLAEWLLLDEVSRLEAAGEGHAKAVHVALASSRPAVLSIRHDRLAVLVERYGLETPTEVFEPGQSVERFVERLANAWPREG